MAPTPSGSVASYKDRLSRITSEVLDVAEELEIPQSASAASAEDSRASARRSSRRSARPAPSIGSPASNGVEAESSDEITKYKQDIKKLQASEAEIKALSFNYAALLKEKEEQLSRLREENGSLKKKMDAKRTVTHEARDGSKENIPIGSNVLKGTVDQSPGRSMKQASQSNTNSSGNHAMKGNVSKQGGFSNGDMQSFQHDAVNRKIELSAISPENGQEQIKLLEENNKSLLATHSRHESDIKLLKAELDRERENAMALMVKLQEEQRLNESSQRELQGLKRDKENITLETQELRNELNDKISESRRQQVESSKTNIEESNRPLEDMKNRIRMLEKENTDLKTEREKLEANLKLSMKSTPEKRNDDYMDHSNRKSNLVIEEMSLSVKKLEDALRNTCSERDKALQEAARLKQHLLEKELADSDKMDEDDRTIEELTANFEKQKAHIFYLEKALRQESAKKEEINKLKDDETKRLSEIIDGLNKKLADCMKTVDLKNDELLNLQTALGQYYAEMDAKDRLRSDLAVAREEVAKYSEFVQAANQKMEVLKREKEDIAAKLSQAERMLSESKYSIQKLEDDNSKLRTVLERSMTTLNRMSLDSDNYVDRRIVIKLLVTYFQRNHSKEVLDLMVRMLGFSEEEKKRIGVAQHAAGKGVVRGVLGLPGRFVGGILGGSSPEASSNPASENQSFADLWVDFLVKETEERERRESSQSARTSSAAQDQGADANTRAPSLNKGPRFANIPTLSTADLLANQTASFHAKQNQSSERSDSEFATVPLTPSVPESSYSRKPPRY